MIICGYCYHDNTDEGHDNHCAFKRGSRWDLDGIHAPNSCPLKINENEWEKDSTGRWTFERNSTRVGGEIVFGATVAVTKNEMQMSKHDIMYYKKDKMACDLGVKIMQEKGWSHYEDNGLFVAETRLYVFTPAELMDFMHAKFKKKLQEMAKNEEYLTESQREALMIQSERF